MGFEAFLLVAFVIGYLFGSIPFGLVLTKLAGTQDLRTIGSGNIGATNVLRTGRKGLAAATLILDALKGTAAVVLAGYLGGPNAAMVAGLGRPLSSEQVLRGFGVPGLRGGRGDLVVNVLVDTPTRLDARQEELLRELAAIRGEESPDGSVRAPHKGMFGKLRDAFNQH